MTDECLNPECDRGMSTIGVCVSCAFRGKPNTGFSVEDYKHVRFQD